MAASAGRNDSMASSDEGHVQRGAQHGRDAEEGQSGRPACAAGRPRRSGPVLVGAPPGRAVSSSCRARSTGSPVARICWSRRCRTWVRHSGRLRIRGARPSGCSDSRSTLTGGSSSHGAAPSIRAATAGVGVDHGPVPVEEDRRIRLVAGQHVPQRREHGRQVRPVQLPFGDRPGRTRRPAAARLRVRSGTSSTSASRRIISRVGCERPVSTNDRWRADTPARVARWSWLSRLVPRHSRSNSPTRSCPDVGAGRCHYLRGNRPRLPPAGEGGRSNPRGRTDMSEFDSLVERYLADLERDRSLGPRARPSSDLFAEDVRYIDPVAAVEGQDALDGLIGAVQQQFPGLVFSRGRTGRRASRAGAGSPGAWAGPARRRRSIGFDVAEVAPDGRIRARPGLPGQGAHGVSLNRWCGRR